MPVSLTCPSCGRTTGVADLQFSQFPCAGCGATITAPGKGRNRTVLVLAVALLGMVMCGGVAVALFWPSIQAVRETVRKSQCRNNMEQISMALKKYYDAYQSFPPAYIADADGMPLHSWRVLLLPYLGRQDLYDRYNFNEPWDGPNNQPLLSAMPSAYACPSNPSPRESGFTSYAVVVGPGTLFDGPVGHSINEVRDGTSVTIAVVETSQASLNWLEPKDLDRTKMIPTINGGYGEISSHHPGDAHVMMADGRAGMFPNDFPTEGLRAWLTRAGGEQTPGDPDP